METIDILKLASLLISFLLVMVPGLVPLYWYPPSLLVNPAIKAKDASVL